MIPQAIVVIVQLVIMIVGFVILGNGIMSGNPGITLSASAVFLLAVVIGVFGQIFR